MKGESEQQHDFTDEELAKYHNLVNTCDFYKAEYKDCYSIRARLHQLFVFGETIDCESRKEDYDNCLKWRKTEDIRALNEVTRNELLRREQRLNATRATSQIWELREEPPSEEEWRPRLPEYLQRKVDKNTIGMHNPEKSSCVLM